jgi:hypothetical protein
MPTTPDCTNCPIYHQRQTTQPGIKATNQRKFDIATELAIVCAYTCDEKSTPQLAVEKDCTQDTIQNIVRRYNKPLRSLRDAQLLRRGSTPPTLPASTEVPHLLQHPNSKSYFPQLIAIMLLTDGGAGYRQGNRPYITFTNKAQSLHNIFADLNHYHYNQPPSAYYKPYWSKPKKQGSKAYYTTYNRKEDTETMLQDLYKLSPTFRTEPKHGQTWEEYNKEEPQPTLRFLLYTQYPEELRVFALRLAMSTEGSISPAFRSGTRFPYPHLLFSCKHPILKVQWRKFFKTFGIHFEPTIEQLETHQLQISERFLELGGFLDGIPVQENSYYFGLERNDVLQAIMVNRRDYPIDRTLPLTQRHARLREKAEQFKQKREREKREKGGGGASHNSESV